MKYAYKVNLPSNFAEGVHVGEFAGVYSGIFKTYETDNTAKNILLLPKCLQDKKVSFYMAKVDFDGDVKEGPPHTHFKDSCLINFYLKTNGEETFFYEGEQVDAAPEINDSTPYHRVLSLNHLQKVESFVAQNNEAWLLKTNQPHSLSSTTKSGTREMLQVYFDESTYEEIVSLLES
jgi:hypothetical protein